MLYVVCCMLWFWLRLLLFPVTVRLLMVVVVVVLVAVLLFVAAFVIDFLLLVAGCADVLMCCGWLRGQLVSFSSNQNHDLSGALPQLPI